jgi:sortase A
MNSRRKGSGCTAIGLLLVAAALCLSVYNITDANRANRASVSVAAELVEQLETTTPSQDMELIPDYLAFPEKAMPAVEIDGQRYVGCLEIPDLQLLLPVTEGEQAESNLRNAPGQYAGSVYLKNMVIGAHNYVRHFGRLSTLKSGAEVFFTDADGNRFAYTVGWSEILEKTDVEGMVTADDWDLTLYTCTYSGEKRLALRCSQTQL